MQRIVVIALAALAGLGACGDDGEVPMKPLPPPETAATAAIDAGVPDAASAGAVAPTEPGLMERFRPRPPPPRTIELTLRSTPPGALAAVDGAIIGPTPTFWSGRMTGKAREFTFVLDGYALARYRFVPVKDGIVHATLTPIQTNDDADAGP